MVWFRMDSERKTSHNIFTTLFELHNCIDVNLLIAFGLIYYNYILMIISGFHDHDHPQHNASVDIVSYSSYRIMWKPQYTRMLWRVERCSSFTLLFYIAKQLWKYGRQLLFFIAPRIALFIYFFKILFYF